MPLLDHKPVRWAASCFFPAPTIYATRSDSGAGSSEEVVALFRRDGFVVRRVTLEEKAVRRAVDVVWSHCPAGWNPSDPNSWRGPVEDSLCRRTVRQRKGRLKFRECVREEPGLREMIAGNPKITGTLKTLLGQDAESEEEPSCSLRGLYPVFPSAVFASKRPRPHTDGHPFQIGVMLYLSDVRIHGGGFTVWPGSHLNMRDAYHGEGGPGWKKTYHQILYEIALRQAAVEITGPVGTCIFWHHRLAHTAGFNRGHEVRQALLADFQSAEHSAWRHQPVAGEPWKYWQPAGAFR